MLGNLPAGVLDIVLRQLGARSLCRLACTSKGMGAAVAQAPLRVTLHPRQGAATRRWMLDPKVQCRVVVLTVRRGSLPHTFVYPRLSALRVLDMAFTYVPMRTVHAVAAVTSLRTLRLHRVSAWDTAVFGTSVFAPLVHLEELAVTFRSESWTLVCVDALPATLRELSIRHAPAMLVCARLDVPKVRLEAGLSLEFMVPAGPGARDVSLACEDEAIDLGKAFDAPGVRALSVACPGSVSLSSLAAIKPTLRTLAINTDMLFLVASELAELEDARFDVAVGLGIKESGPLPPSLTLRATLGDLKFDFRGAVERYRQGHLAES